MNINTKVDLNHVHDMMYKITYLISTTYKKMV